jgi:adenosine deaminase
VRLRENGDLLNYLNDHRIPLEMCPSSNVQTRSVASYESHPLEFYFDYGLRVTINTDNRLVTDTTLTKELVLAHQRMGLGLDDLCTVLVQGFKSAFLPFREKAEMLRRVNAEIAEVRARVGVPAQASGARAAGAPPAPGAPAARQEPGARGANTSPPGAGAPGAAAAAPR